ncbi:hypothetical protein [Streptomyces sp. NPDC058855]|uniref:hypothetical protein n=1 Tax=Streptomyces sp. NPDC058855 TaxID=3346651 RepID=UPI00369B77E0
MQDGPRTRLSALQYDGHFVLLHLDAAPASYRAGRVPGRDFRRASVVTDTVLRVE